MTIELKKIDRYAFPSGVLDFAVMSDGQQLYAACMDGIYELQFTEPSKEKEKAKPKRIGRHESYVSSIALIESTHSLLSTAYDGTFQIRDLKGSLAALAGPATVGALVKDSWWIRRVNQATSR